MANHEKKVIQRCYKKKLLKSQQWVLGHLLGKSGRVVAFTTRAFVKERV